MKQNNVLIDEMFLYVLENLNKIITALKDMDPTSHQYQIALDNLTKSFQILSGAPVAKTKPSNKGDTDGDK